MVVLALDTTTRAGSIALTRDGVVVEVFAGDAARTHATRLPGDLLDVLARQALTLGDVDLFAVAAGPGSFTGLRIGIATIQGLAFAEGKQVVAVSALEALAHAALEAVGHRAPVLIGAWMDAQRHELYAELYRVSADGAGAAAGGPDHSPGGCSVEVVQPAAVGEPPQIIESWRDNVETAQGLVLAGDGALVYRSAAEAAFSGVTIVEPVPPLAPSIARLAEEAARRGSAGPPHAIRPVYVRRPDAELARDRRVQPGGEDPPHV
jgi:tRNA threonylcarbamoyladenosine biosynthesis protein TsaB